MANSPANTNRLFDGGNNFYLGVNSYFNPQDLPNNQISWLVNGRVDSGNIVTRPDYNVVIRVPDGRAQGLVLFTPTDGIPNLVFAVSGNIYVSAYPFTSYVRLNSVSFDPYVDQIFFKEATQAVSNGVLVPPRSVLLMQDGVTRPAYWDGTINRHLNPGGTTNETPIGIWMEFVGGRLWVARDRQIFASDIFNPLSFTEITYVAGGQSLQTPDGDVITALKRTADSKSLLAFTIKNTALILASITDRTQWANTPSFVSTLFPGVGCVAGKSFAENNGALWWYSLEGARNFTQVAAQIQTSGVAVASHEMKRSFDNSSPTLNRVCGFGFKSFTGFSIPSGDVYNRHTWIIDNSVANLLSTQLPSAWNGVWMGTRPVEWASGYINGMNRCFYLSQDSCGVRIWEAFAGNTGKDNGGKIFVSAELNGCKFSSEVAFKKYLYSEYYLRNLFGDVSFTSEYRSDWGCWKNNASLNLCSQTCLTKPPCDTHIGTYQENSRFIRTSNSIDKCDDAATDAPYAQNVGSFFQNRLRWYGKNGLRMYKMHGQQFEEPSVGQCSFSDVTCKLEICCDQEQTYISHVDDGGYYCHSSSSDKACCSI